MPAASTTGAVAAEKPLVMVADAAAGAPASASRVTASAVVGLVWVSNTRSSVGWPATPPASLIFLTAVLAPAWPPRPLTASPPVRSPTKAIWIGPPAAAAAPGDATGDAAGLALLAGLVGAAAALG